MTSSRWRRAGASYIKAEMLASEGPLPRMRIRERFDVARHSVLAMAVSLQIRILPWAARLINVIASKRQKHTSVSLLD